MTMEEPEYSERGCFAVELANGEQYRVSRFCPHRGGRLDHGEVDRTKGRLVCPLHRSVFEVKTGAQLAGPPSGRLVVECGAAALEEAPGMARGLRAEKDSE